MTDAAWQNILLRIRSVCPESRTAIVTMRLVVVDGQPRIWSKPTVMMIEPTRDSAELLRLLAGENVDRIDML